MNFEKRELVKHLYPSSPTSNKHFISLFDTKSNNMVMLNDGKLKKVLIIRVLLKYPRKCIEKSVENLHTDIRV